MRQALCLVFEIATESRNSYLGDRRIRATIAACKEWPRGEVSNGFTAPLKTNNPILVFSGEADGAAPPWFAASAMKYWPNGRQVIFPHTGHQGSVALTSWSAVRPHPGECQAATWKS